MSTAVISLRTDETVKKKFDRFCDELGMNTSTAINMFIRECVRNRELPFRPSLRSEIPTKELREAIKEADDMASGKIRTKK